MTYLVAKESKGIQQALPIVNATEKHQSIMVSLVLAKTGAVRERFHELSPFAWNNPMARSLATEEARAVHQVHPFLPASKGSP